MILAKLCYSEHVRSERVSKRFKRVGLDLSWHDVTVLIQQDLLEAYESNPEKMVWGNLTRVVEKTKAAF
jgi:hypothetical protein